MFFGEWRDKVTEFFIGNRLISFNAPPLVIAEIGINHEGSMEKAFQMVDDAERVGCECVKFQSHVIEDEMAVCAKDVIPGNATESIWDIMSRCALDEDQEIELMNYVEAKGMIYLSTPFSRAAADRLEGMGVAAYKIGSGECNNYPLIEHIAKFSKPVILSTGMNDLPAIAKSVELLRDHDVPFALLHCTSIYPTPYDKVRLGAMTQLGEHFNTDLIGLSDHSTSNYPCLGAAALGACILERHFTSDMSWPGPDIPISMDPQALEELIAGSNAMFQARGGAKTILKEEAPTIAFAYACLVSIAPIKAGEVFSRSNIWVKRPGTGEIKAEDFDNVLGRKALKDIVSGAQISWADIE